MVLKYLSQMCAFIKKSNLIGYVYITYIYLHKNEYPEKILFLKAQCELKNTLSQITLYTVSMMLCCMTVIASVGADDLN